MAGEEGFEPPILGPEPSALPLGHSPLMFYRLATSQYLYYYTFTEVTLKGRESMSSYTVIKAHEIKDVYEGTDVPGEFRPLKNALKTEQLAVTFLHIPPHSDFEQGTGHYHDELEELYLVTRGTLTMRFGDDILKIPAGSAVRVSPKTLRSHRNEGDEPVEIWAVSKKINHDDSNLIKVFWEASPKAKQKR